MEENIGEEINNDSQEAPKPLFSSGTPKLQGFLQEKSKQKGQDLIIGDVSKLGTENLYNTPLLAEIQKKLINEINAASVQSLTNDMELKNHIESLLDSISDRDYLTITRKEKQIIIQSLMDEFTGFGPLQKLVLDPSVSEIMVNGSEQVYVERNGVLVHTEVKFRDNEHVVKIIDKIVSPLGRRIDEASPMVDARLPDGSRVNAIIPPVSIKGPVLTIRKFSEKLMNMNTLVSYGSLNDKMAKFLEMAIKARTNIIVAGGTGSGKTTFLNVLSSYIPPNDRVITIEDAAELNLIQPHVVSLEARPANIEGRGEITIRDLVRNSLRMRPDRIIVGEVRGAETLDMLQAMNTGHNGSMSTVHANSPRDAISRLETMVLYTGIDFPLRAIREQICSALDLIIYTERLYDGTRKVTLISEVIGMEGDIVVLQDVFYFDKNVKSNGKIRGEYKATSIRPKTYDKFESLGIC